MNVYELIRRENAGRTERAALRDDRCALSYAELFERTESMAARLRELGVKRADRTALFCDDGLDYVVASLAILSLDAVIVPVPPTSAEHETDALLERIGADWLLYDVALTERGGRALDVEPAGGRRLGLTPGPGGKAPEGFAALRPAFIRFSSGTTGCSKGVVLSHETIVERTDAADKGLGITPDDVVLWVLSMSYHFVVSILLFLRRGATIRLCRDDFPTGLRRALAEGEGTFIYAAPFHYHLLASSENVAPEASSRVRMAVSTSMKLPPETARLFAEKFGFGLTEAYGIIEVGLPFVQRAEERMEGSVGRLLPDYEIRLEHPDADGIGEILLRGRGTFDAYYSPWRPFGPEEWFATGDLGRLDAAGRLFIVGRKKSVVNFMGMKVFPEEVEAVLDAHPAVRESLVGGEPHPRYGQLPAARVVCEGDVDEGELVAHCLRELAPHKVPKRFDFVESLPRTPSGKLKRS